MNYYEVHQAFDAGNGMMLWAEIYHNIAGSVMNVVQLGIDEVRAQEQLGSLPMWQETEQTFQQMHLLLASITITVLPPLLAGLRLLIDHISIIGPLLLGLGSAFAVFKLAVFWTRLAIIATETYKIVKQGAAIVVGLFTGQMGAASAAALTFNSTLLASPITWVVMGIMLLVGALYAGVAAYNKLTGSSVSATGIIMGAIQGLGAFVQNYIAMFVNLVAGFAEFILNVFQNPVYSVKMLFLNLLESVLGVIENITGVVDKIFKTDWSSKVSLAMDGLETMKIVIEDG